MHDIHIRLSDELHDCLVDEVRRRPKLKNKSELARRIIEEGLARGSRDFKATGSAEPRRADADQIELLHRLLELGVFTELALTEFLGKRPGLVDDLKRRAREALEAIGRRSSRTPKAVERRPASRPPAQPEPESPDDLVKKDPRKMTKEERAAWKKALARELTGQTERT
jgi:hypothetical protein